MCQHVRTRYIAVSRVELALPPIARHRDLRAGDGCEKQQVWVGSLLRRHDCGTPSSTDGHANSSILWNERSHLVRCDAQQISRTLPVMSTCSRISVDDGYDSLSSCSWGEYCVPQHGRQANRCQVMLIEAHRRLRILQLWENHLDDPRALLGRKHCNRRRVVKQLCLLPAGFGGRTRLRLCRIAADQERNQERWRSHVHLNDERYRCCLVRAGLVAPFQRVTKTRVSCPGFR